MSLGVRTLWRARAISPAGSLIPRELAASAPPVRPTDPRGLSPLRRAWQPSARTLVSECPDAKRESPTISDDKSLRASTTEDATEEAFSQRLARVPVRPHDAWSILVRSGIEYPHSRESRLHSHKRHRESTAQRRHEALARANHEPLPDWRRVLQELYAATPQYVNGIARVLLSGYPRDTLLDPDADKSLWDIRSRTRCYMELEKESDQHGNTVLKIAGPRTAVESAIDEILQVTKRLKVLLLSNGVETVIYDGIPDPADTQLTEPETRTAITPTRLHIPWKPDELATSAQDVPKPSCWTKKSFEQYVATLTYGHLPLWKARRLYRRAKTTHQHAVVKQLIDVFYDPDTEASLSSEAFKMALHYIGRAGRAFRPHARVLFDRMERKGIPTDTTVFNLLIESTIHDKDLRNFANCVYLMIKRGHEPNVKTWLLFLRLSHSEEVRRYILQAMDHKKLLASPTTLAQVAYVMARYDAERAIRQDWDLDTFLAEQDKLYGPEWQSWKLATHTCNQIIEVMAKHGKWAEVPQFVNYMASHPSAHLGPDVHTMNICVEHARVQRKVKAAIDLLQLFEGYGLVPDMLTLQSLFMLFWFYKMPHAIATVWQYALVTAQTSHTMHTRIKMIWKLAAGLGWSSEIPTRSDTIPEPEHAKNHAMYALLETSSRDLFNIKNSVKGEPLSRLLERGAEMREDGHVPRPGLLSQTLKDMIGRDTRFHRQLMEGKWFIEPALLPIEATGSAPNVSTEAQGDAKDMVTEALEGVEI